ncbi:MAG: cobalt ECF transporter T component CbiQ [Euryarchaeota archaeon]|nr:cobalt ECF transporter T component CbiQ [Euryarchaeota archaeon]
MGAIESSLTNIEQESMKESIIHSLDGRIKVIVLLFIIVYAVYTTELLILFIMEVYLLFLIYLSKISFIAALKRILLLLPFAGFIAVFQPFIRPGDVIYVLPFGIDITYQGLMFGILLMSRLFVCLTAIVLLSSSTSMQEVVTSFRKLGMPQVFAMLLSLMIRYLFMFYDELGKIRNSQRSRNFDIFNRKTTYMWRLKQIGYTITMMFLRSYEQGEKVYLSMLSRGYSADSNLYNENKKLGSNDFALITATLCLIISLQVLNYFSII